MKLINPEIRIENTNRCSAECIICPREKLKRQLTTMHTNNFTNIVSQAYELGAKTISVFGYGEPLMDWGLANKVAFCKDYADLDTFVSTTGYMLGVDKATDLLDAGLTHIRFSVHGIRPDEYEDVHRGLFFDKTMRAIGNFIAKNKTKYRHMCKVGVSVIPMHGETVEEIKEFWGDKPDYLEIWKPHNWTEGREYREPKRKKKTCGRPVSGPIQVNADGTVMVCCFDYNGELTVGDTNGSTLEAIIKGDKFNAIREKHESGDLSGLICETCDQLNIGDNPLLYSSRDEDRKIDCTSSIKFEIGGN